MKKITFFLLVIFPAFFMKAQNGWGLKECITYGLEHHLSNEIHRANMEKAKQQTNENIALYFPQISGDVYFDDYLKRQTQFISFSGLDSFQSAQDIEIRTGTKFATTASVQFDQTLFDKVLLNSFRGLKPNRTVAQLTFRQNQEALIYNIAQAYIQVYVIRQQIALLRENVRKYEKLLEIVSLQVEKGVAKKVDRDRIVVALNNTKSQLSVAESNYELGLNRLKNAVGLELSAEITLKDSVTIGPVDKKMDNAFDVSGKTEIQLQQNTIRLLEVQRNRISGAYYPRLAFYAKYANQSLSNEFSNAFSEWNDYYSIGLKLEVPIFDGLQKRAQSKQAGLAIQNARYNLKLNEDAFRLQYQNASTQLNRARLNLENNNQNVKLAKDVFDNTALQYQQGVAPLSEFINAETSYKEAQSNYITSMLNYYMAVIDFEKAKGTLEAFYRNL
ncbi:MAG TPA: TolC family protein [Chitinophagales bacterium]|nr:TolC family protein [Chitinophagales bacterium]